MNNHLDNHAIDCLLSELDELNTLIFTRLEDDRVDSDASDILAFVGKRDELVSNILEKLNGEQQVSFAKREYETQQKLMQSVKSLFELTKKNAIHFVRSQRSLDKYKR